MGENMPDVAANAYGGVAGTIAVVGVAEATATLNGTTRAYIGEGATVQSGFGGVNVTATEPTGGSVSATTVLVDVSENIGITVMSATTDTADVVEAYLGAETGTTSTGQLTTITTSGPVQVDAHSALSALSKGDSGGLSLRANVGVSLMTTDLDGSTAAYIGQGQATINAGSVTLDATSNDESSAETILVSIAITASGIGANVTADDGRDVLAYVAAGADVTVTSSGTLTVEADSTENAEAQADGGSGAFNASVAVMLVSADSDGNTEAYISQGATVTAGVLEVSATATNNEADATAVVVAISLGLSGSGSNTTGTTGGNVEAYIGPEQGTTPSSAVTTIDVTGAIDLSANSQEQPQFGTEVGAGGLIAGDGATGSATDQSATSAYFGQGVTVTNAGAIDVTASSTSAPNGDVQMGSGGIISASGASATAEDDSQTQAYLGQNDSISNTGALTIRSTNVSNPIMSMTIGDGGLISGGGGDAEAHSYESNSAYIGAGSTITDGGTQAVSVEATTLASPSSDITVGSGGAISVSAAISNANAEDHTTASIGNNVTISSNGALNVIATDTDNASDDGTVGGGGALAGQGTSDEAFVTPTLTAYIGQSDMINAAGNVQVYANSVHAQASSSAKAFGGGGVEVGIPNDTAVTNPTITAYVGSSTDVYAGGSITIQGNEQSASTGPEYTDYIQSVDASNNSVNFPEHGLQTGDLVEYVPNSSGGPVLETPQGPLPANDYRVIDVDANNLQFGDAFDAEAVPPATTAIADTSISSESVSAINLIGGGTDYTSPPTVTIAPPASGTQATATAIIAQGVVVGFDIINHGSGYMSPPAVTIEAPADTLNVFQKHQGVDTTGNVISFGSSFGSQDYLYNGLEVEYVPGTGFAGAANTPISPLTANADYFVRQITPSTIKLYTSEAQADQTPVTFGAVAGQRRHDQRDGHRLF